MLRLCSSMHDKIGVSNMVIPDKVYFVPGKMIFIPLKLIWLISQSITFPFVLT
jgi:hypothetical protein